jgi:hypothetical protein
MKVSRATIHHFNEEELNIPTKKEQGNKYFCSFLSYSNFFYMHKKERNKDKGEDMGYLPWV